MSKREFLRRMENLEMRFFGQKLSAMPSGNRSLANISGSSHRPGSTTEPKLDSHAKEFIVQRYS